MIQPTLACTKVPSCQAGGMLIEALIGVLVMAIIGGGILHATSRMLNVQRDMAVANVAINELRPLVMSRTYNGADVCSLGNLQVSVVGEDSPISVTKSGCTPVDIRIENISINGVALGTQVVSAPQPLVLQVGSGDDAVTIGGNHAQ